MKRALTVLAWLIAVPLAVVTAVANFRFGWLVGSGEERYVYAIGGTVLDVAKTFLPTFLITFLAGRKQAGTFPILVLGWSFWCLGVVWSIICALGLYTISREARVGDTKGQQATYQQLTSDQTKKADRLRELGSVKPRETIEGDIAAQKRDRLWNRTKECSDATATESRAFCAGIDTLTASLATAPLAADVAAEQDRLRDEMHGIERKLAGMNMQAVFEKADPATDALVDLTGWPAETVKSRMALLLAMLFEVGGVLLLIANAGHGIPEAEAPRASKRQEPALSKPQEATAAQPDAVGAKAVDLPEDDGLVAQWARSALIRRKGSFTPPADVRSDFDAWCRLHGHDIMNPTAFGKQMTILGFDRRKVGGNLRYVDIALLPKSRDLKLVASN